ncbi:MAG: sugar phosphate isomerase/epimerase [Lentisphaeria bacterium]|nr:MAG: sugar phosphate isomerase/epimerase [Lentisphaeria bacterium]
MQKITIAAQMFSFRNYIKTPAGVRDTFRRLKQMGYDAIQLSGSIAPMPTADLAAMLRDEGLTAPTSHSFAKTIVEEPEKEAERLLELGCRHTAYPFPHWRPTGEGEVIELARELNEAAKRFPRRRCHAGLSQPLHRIRTVQRPHNAGDPLR